MAAPTAPQNVSATPVNSGEDVEITWDAPSNWGGDQGGYRIYGRASPELTDQEVADVGSGQTSYTNTGVGGPGAAPVYHVVAYNVDGDSPESNKDGAITALDDVVDLTGDSPSQGNVRAQWNNDNDVRYHRSEAIGPIDVSTVEIGGGEQYTNIHTSGDYTVSTEAEINTALDSAVAGEVVFIEGSADITLDDHIVVPGGVTLASNRGEGGADGATLRGYGSDPAPIEVNGTLEGVEVVGPVPDYLEFDDRLEYGNARGIECYDSANIANCHVHHYADGGINVDGAANVDVHHCEISDHPVEGLGNGIRATASGGVGERIQIEYNYIHTCRHEIAAFGGSGYVIRYNVFGKEKFENETSDLMQPTVSEGDAGSDHEVYENLFLETDTAAIGWDEDVDSVSSITDNWFWHETESDALTSSTTSGVDASNISGNHYGLSNPPSAVGNPQITDLWGERTTESFGGRILSCNDGYTDVSNQPEFNITGSLTMSIWINPDTVTQSFQGVFAKGQLFGSSSSSDGQYGIGIVDDEVRWQLYDGDTKSGAEAGLAGIDQWYHVVGTYDSSTGDQELYINNSLRTTSNAIDDPLQTTSHGLSIGRDPTRDNVDFNFKGQFTDARLYDRALSSSEVDDLFNGVPVNDGLVGYWPVHVDDSSTVYDFTSNQNHATMVDPVSKSLDESGDTDLTYFNTTEITYGGGSLTVVDGTEYDIRIRTESAYKTGAWQLTSPPSQLPSPDTPALNVLSTNEIDVSWAFNDNYTGGYVKLHRSKSSGDTGELVEKLDDGTTSYSDSGLDPGTFYWYTVVRHTDYTSSQEQGGGGTSDRTNLAPANDVAVDNIRNDGTIPGDVAELTWVDPNGSVDQNIVELSTDEGSSWTEEEVINISSSDPEARSHETSELLDGTEYDARIVIVFGSETAEAE